MVSHGECFKMKIARGTYVIGDPQTMLDPDVDPLWSIPLENGKYKDQFDSTYNVVSGRLSVALSSLIKHPHVLKHVISTKGGCCGQRVAGDGWSLGWTRQFSVLWSMYPFDVSAEDKQIGPLKITRVDG